MPAQRTKPSLGPRSLELLYSKYGPDSLHDASASTSSKSPSTTKPVPSPLTSSPSSPQIQNFGKSRNRRPLPPALKGSELGDLTKLGNGLSKLERVHLLLDMPHARYKNQLKSGSQPSSDGPNSSSLPNAVCSECCQAHGSPKSSSRLKDVKSKLRLVAPRSFPDRPAPQSGSSSAQQSSHSQNVVPLPLLHIRFQRQDSGPGALPAVYDARQVLRRMLLPHHDRSIAADWSLKTTGSSQPAPSRELADSMDTSSRFLTSAGMPPSSGLAERQGTATISTYDADRVDSEQFDYVFERFSTLSTESDSSTATATPESDTATFSARAQRPSTTDTVVTHQRLTHSRSSRSRPLAPLSARLRAPTSRGSSPLSPLTPQRRARASLESWPPRFTVIPSWPALDDPFRFQYLGHGVQRDIVRRLHRSRGGKKHVQHSRHEDPPKAELPPPQQEAVPLLPQKLEIVVPTHTECHLCRTHDCGHTTPRQAHTTARSTRPPSLSALSGLSEGGPEPRNCLPPKGPVPADPEVSWCLEKRCVSQGNDVTFHGTGHYTAQSVMN